jgi:putative membrane protein
MWDMHTSWGWWWMTVAMVAFWGFVAWVAVTLVRQRGTRRFTSGPQEILDERYARGEINDDEYQRRSELVRR